MRYQYINILISLFILGAAIAGASVLIAQASSEADIIYPAAELGNCKNKDDCFKYCEDATHLGDCVAFAETHNLLPADELEKAKKFKEIKTGPLGCNSKKKCEEVCNDVANIEICVEFGDKNGFFKGKEKDEALKVRDHIRRGGKLPNNCRTKDECDKTCQSPKTKNEALSCFQAAKDMKILPPEFNEEKTQKMFELIDKGDVDFAAMRKCEGMERGENLDDATIVKCLEIGEKLGFIKPAEAKLARATKGKGPGGCLGKNACESFCNNETNQEVCSNFMNEILEKNPDLNIEEFISPEDRGRMQEGLTRIKESFANAPPEVEACVEASLPGIVAKVKAGTLEQKDMIKIGRRLGEVMPACFQKAFSGGEGGFPDGPGGFPGDPGGHGGPGADQIQKCLAEAGVAPNTPPNKEQESKIRECAQRMSQQGREGRQGGEGGFPGGGATGGEFPGGGRTSGQFPGGGPGGFPGGLPSDAVQKCQAEAGIGAGAPPGPDAIQKMQDCISRSVQGERGLNQGTKEGKDEHSEPGLRRENRLPDGGSQFPGNQGAQGQSPEAIRKNIEEQQKQGIQQHEVQKRIEEETRRQIEERTRQFQGGQGGLPQGLDPRSSLPGGFGQPGQPGGFSGGQQPGGFPTGQPGSFPGSGPAGDHQGGFPGGGAPQQGPGPGGNGPTQGPGPSGPGPGAGGGHQGFNPPSLLNFFAQILFGVAF